MKKSLDSQLLEAKEYFYALRLIEAYHILRRYFDRIPFKPEKGHFEYIGMFVRTLSELGKNSELGFYMEQLENWYEKNKDPGIAYCLAAVYRGLPEPRMEASRKMCEQILQSTDASEYQAKARMLLAHYYDNQGDISACRKLIDSIDEPKDSHLKTLWMVWRAKVLRDERKYTSARDILLELLKTTTLSSDWYGYFSAKVILGGLYLGMGEVEKTKSIIKEVRTLFEGKPLKILRDNLDNFERRVQEKTAFDDVHYFLNDKEAVFSYHNQILRLPRNSRAARLFELFSRNRFVDKSGILDALYERQYKNKEDDKLIYYHVHNLRNKMKSIGIPEEALVLEGSGYKFIPSMVIESKRG